jgi:hypothetical protein
MEAKHTPGPWMVHPLDRRAVVGRDGDSAIADVHTWRDMDDALLIAAAPDLLEALRLCRDYLSCIPESAAGGDDEAVRLERAASALIAQATGGAA